MNQELEQFLKQYETATNTHDFNHVASLIAKEAVYWFSDGSFVGIDEIRKAFINTWNKIREEKYRIDNIQWVSCTDTAAVCIYNFHWEGIVDGEKLSGHGRGTNVIGKVDGQWKMLHEHLSRGDS